VCSAAARTFPFGGVGDDDAAVRRGVDVDVVDADAGSADDREFVGGCEDFLGDLGARADDQSVRVRNRLEEVVALEFVARFDVVAGVSEYVQTRVCDRIRDENLHARDNRVENVNPSVVARGGKNTATSEAKSGRCDRRRLTLRWCRRRSSFG